MPTYEYIVVGSGAGGGPLASRLALAGFKVLLIEAGDDQGFSIPQEVPGLNLQASEYEPMSWGFFVNHYQDLARQEKDSKMTYRTPSGGLFVGTAPPSGSTPLGILYPRAGTLGGCSAHNALISIYPHDSDWSNIQSITGDSSWAPDKMRTYFERLENNHYLPQGTAGHGFSGWLGTSLTPLSLVFQDAKLVSIVAAAAAGLGQGLLSIITTITGLANAFLVDINDNTSKNGLYQVPIATTNSHRSSTRDFIWTVANATNPDGSRKYTLDIMMHTFVTKVLLDQSQSPPQAYGVSYLQGESLYSADRRANTASKAAGVPGSINATREVILSTGTFNTPQLLKLSGIGPEAELTQFGIPVVVNLPGVGTNLQDRYESTVIGEISSDFEITSKCTFLNSSPDPCLEDWQGPNAAQSVYSTNGIALGIIHTSSVAAGDPDLFLSGAPINFTGYFPGYADVAEQDKRHWAWITLKAHSRNNAGTVALQSTDPLDTPVINFNSFDTGNTAGGADQLDLEASYEGMELARNIFRDRLPIQGSFKEVWPGPSVRTEAEMKTFVQNEAWGHHASCTCPIGADDDPNAVLNSDFQVRGTTNLRVVDASVFPKIPGFYIAVPIYMISEKAADVIIAAATV